MRRLLLDTHVLLWWLADDPGLGRHVRVVIQDARNDVHISAASAWEIAIKRALGKLEAPDDLESIVEEEGFEKLPITFFHGEQAGRLPPVHRDPFDRMLIAQAQAEGLEIVSHDSVFSRYGVRQIDASR